MSGYNSRVLFKKAVLTGLLGFKSLGILRQLYYWQLWSCEAYSKSTNHAQRNYICYIRMKYFSYFGTYADVNDIVTWETPVLIYSCHEK